MLQRGLCSATVRLWKHHEMMHGNSYGLYEFGSLRICLMGNRWRAATNTCNTGNQEMTYAKTEVQEKQKKKMTWNCSVPPSRWHCTTVKISIRYPNSQLSLFSLVYLANISASMFHVIAIPAPFFLYKHYFFFIRFAYECKFCFCSGY